MITFEQFLKEKLTKKYSKGLSDKEKEKKIKEIEKRKKMSDDDPNAYDPFPTDIDKKTKPSKHTKKYKEIYGSVEEAEYQGKKVELEQPFRLDNDNKKFGVYVKNDKGNVILVKFGDPNMEIKRDDPERLKSFRARHNCDDKKDKTKAGYWSCQMWRKDKSVSDILKG